MIGASAEHVLCTWLVLSWISNKSEGYLLAAEARVWRRQSSAARLCTSSGLSRTCNLRMFFVFSSATPYDILTNVMYYTVMLHLLQLHISCISRKVTAARVDGLEGGHGKPCVSNWRRLAHLKCQSVKL